MTATFFLLGSSIFHALWNSLLKTKQQRQLYLLLSIVVATVAAWLLATFFEGIHFGDKIYIILFCGIFEGLYFVTLTKALEEAPLAVSYSVMRSLSMILTWILSAAFLGETMNFVAAGGALLVLVGLLIPLWIKKSPKEKKEKIFWSCLCALTIVGYNYLYNRSMVYGTAPLSLFAASLTISLPFLYFAVPKREKNYSSLRKICHKDAVGIIILGTIILGSFSFFLYGLQHILPALAITIRNTSIAFALIFSWIMGEKLTRQDIWILLFIVAGVFIISCANLNLF